MDFSIVGLKEAAIKVGKIAIYIALSGAITALIDYITPLTTGEFGAVYALINLVLGFLKTWVTTQAPKK